MALAWENSPCSALKILVPPLPAKQPQSPRHRDPSP